MKKINEIESQMTELYRQVSGLDNNEINSEKIQQLNDKLSELNSLWKIEYFEQLSDAQKSEYLGKKNKLHLLEIELNKYSVMLSEVNEINDEAKLLMDSEYGIRQEYDKLKIELMSTFERQQYYEKMIQLKNKMRYRY
jgi:hypothetical protein